MKKRWSDLRMRLIRDMTLVERVAMACAAVLLASFMLFGCMSPAQRLGSPAASQEAVSQSANNSSGLQVNKAYNDGDPWPFRVISVGLVIGVVGLMYSSRALSKSVPIGKGGGK